jgi:hypothetical protein
LVFYGSGGLKFVFCRPSVHRQHRWPWQPPGQYIAASSGIKGSPEHATSSEARHITRYRYSRHGHHNRSIRLVTSGLWIVASECTILT